MKEYIITGKVQIFFIFVSNWCFISIPVALAIFHTSMCCMGLQFPSFVAEVSLIFVSANWDFGGFFSVARMTSLRVGGVKCCASCKALWGKFVICVSGSINKTCLGIFQSRLFSSSFLVLRSLFPYVMNLRNRKGDFTLIGVLIKHAGSTEYVF